MGPHEQAQHRHQDEPQVGGDARLLGQLHEEVAEAGHDHGQDSEPELGCPPAGEPSGAHGVGGAPAAGTVVGVVGVVALVWLCWEARCRSWRMYALAALTEENWP